MVAIVAHQADALVFPATFVRDKFERYVGPPTVQLQRDQTAGLFRTPARQAELHPLRETARLKLGIPAEAHVISTWSGERRPP